MDGELRERDRRLGRWGLLGLVVAVAAAGCGSKSADGEGIDAGVAVDAGRGEPDAGEADAGPPDGGRTPDGGCELGETMSLANPDDLNLFGTPAYFNDGEIVAPGRYRVRYLDGCMKYASSQGWTVNAYAADRSCWYVIGETTADRYVVPPGTVGFSPGMGAFTEFEDCVRASAEVPPVELEIETATRLGVWLLDSPYSDNLAGVDGRNPRWALERVSEACGGDPTD